MRPILLASIFLIVSIGISHGQEVVGSQIDPPRVDFLSPQTYEFVKYGNLPVSHFNGEVDVKIPIYTYSDKDFELPLFLGYNSSGFIPAKREGIVGLNWYLNSGAGVITRRVNGFPDEKTGNPTNIPTELHGYYYGIKNNLITSLTKAQLFNPSNGQVMPTDYWHINNCEIEPDDFTFNIPGLSAKFFIENTGNVRTSGNRPFKVDLTNFRIQPNGTNTNFNDSEIKVTTDDGYVYTFGGTITFLEVSYQIGSEDEALSPVIDAWHLREIKAPNGRSVTYDYEDFVEGFKPSKNPFDLKHYLLHVYDITYLNISSAFVNFVNGLSRYSERTSASASETQTIKSIVKTVYLKKITIDNTAIEFSNGEKEKGFYGTELYSQKTLQVNSIFVKHSGVTIKQFDFGYKYYGGSGMNSRHFLTSFKEIGSGSSGYNFYYNKVDPNFPNPITLPTPKTHAVDHWGFWNAGASNQVLLPDIDYTVNGDQTIVSSERDPDLSKCDVALLSKLVYPTSGYTEFFYEPHYYTKRLERRNDGNFLPKLFNESGTAGGARIKKIRDFDGEKLVNTREFFYSSNYGGGGTQSSGILLSWPRYVIYWKYQIPGSVEQNILRKKSSTFSANHNPGENFIHYGEVTEVMSPSNGFINYKFHDYITRPNFADNLTSVVDQATQDYITNVHCYNNFVGLKYNDRSFERGLPYEVTAYGLKTDGTPYLVKKTVTFFTTNTNYPNDYTVGVHQTGGLAQSYKLYYYPVVPSSVTETLYSEEGTKSTTSTTDYTYNSSNYVLTKSIKLSDGVTQSTKFKYPLDFISDADDFILFMGTDPSPLYLSLPPEIKALVDIKRNNILNRPIEVISYRNTNAIGANCIEQKDFANTVSSKKVYPSKLWTLKTSQPVTAFQEAYISKSSSWTFVKHSAYGTNPEATFDQYDDIGNLLQTTDKTLVKKSYLWGYDNKYPIAEIVGVPYDQFFYTGFEDSEGTSDVSAKVGKKSRPGGYTKSLAGLMPGMYILTYWQKQPDNSWIHSKDELTVSSNPYQLSISSTIHLDELRFYPKSSLSQLSTYTYDPLVGITSKTDVNNKTEYYEYDTGERLKLVRDYSKSIVKSIGYYFQIK